MEWLIFQKVKIWVEKHTCQLTGHWFYQYSNSATHYLLLYFQLPMVWLDLRWKFEDIYPFFFCLTHSDQQEDRQLSGPSCVSLYMLPLASFPFLHRKKKLWRRRRLVDIRTKILLTHMKQSRHYRISLLCDESCFWWLRKWRPSSCLNIPSEVSTAGQKMTIIWIHLLGPVLETARQGQDSRRRAGQRLQVGGEK